MIPELGRQRQAISEFKASLIYRVSSGTARATQRNPVSKKQKPKKPKKTKKKKKKKEKRKEEGGGGPVRGSPWASPEFANLPQNEKLQVVGVQLKEQSRWRRLCFCRV